MVIVCPECSTRFRINSERIPDQGTRVRCARCKHVFTARKEADQTPVRVPHTEPGKFPEEAISKAASEEIESTDFDYDRFRERDVPADGEADFSFTQGVDRDKPEDDDFSFSSKPDESDNDQPTAREASDEEIAQAFDSGDEAEQEAEDAAKTVPQKPKGSPLSSVIRILLLLVLGLAILAGALYTMNGPEQFERAIQQLLGQTEARPVQTGQILLDKLEGKFVQSEQSGELFIIRGEAINKFAEPRAALQVKGIIFDLNGKPLLQKTVFCGNPISDPELKALPFKKMEELMGNQFGKDLSNMNLPAGQTIPFVIVFNDLPQNLSEFSVNVTSSKPASN